MYCPRLPASVWRGKEQERQEMCGDNGEVSDTVYAGVQFRLIFYGSFIRMTKKKYLTAVFTAVSCGFLRCVCVDLVSSSTYRTSNLTGMEHNEVRDATLNLVLYFPRVRYGLILHLAGTFVLPPAGFWFCTFMW